MGYKNSICGIYKISFTQTNKIYVGQSTCIQRRKLEHLHSSFPERYSVRGRRDEHLPIHRAIHKYGWDNTFFEVLEECPREELNDREKYWIGFFKSDEESHGYNLSSGGQDAFGLSGERHSRAKLTAKQVEEIKDLLATQFSLSSRDIANRFKVSYATVCLINNGDTWFEKDRTYPIRPKKISQEHMFGKKKEPLCPLEKVEEVRELHRQGLSYREIGERFHFSLGTAFHVCKHYPPYED